MPEAAEGLGLDGDEAGAVVGEVGVDVGDVGEVDVGEVGEVGEVEVVGGTTATLLAGR